MPENRLDPVGHQAFLQRFDDRDAAADAGLEAHLDAVGDRRCKDLPAMYGEQGLVGGDHVFPLADRFQDKGSGRFDAADELDDDIYRRIVEDVLRVAAENDVLELRRQALDMDVGHPGQDDREAGLLTQPVLLRIYGLGQTAAHRPEANDAHTNFFHNFFK